MEEKDYRIDLGRFTENLTDEQQAKVMDVLQNSRRNSHNTMTDKQAKLAGIIITALFGVMLLFSIYLRFFGGTAAAVCTEAPRTPKHHHNLYSYSVDGKDCWVKHNCTRKNKTQVGDVVTVHYLPAQPMIAYDPNLLWLSIIGTGIGVLFLYGSLKNRRDDGYT